MKSKKFPARWTCACNSRTTGRNSTISVDRVKAAEFGLTEQNVANSVLLGLSGSSQVQPAYWLDPNVGIQYLINVRAPEYAMDSVQQLNAMPISAGAAAWKQRANSRQSRHHLTRERAAGRFALQCDAGHGYLRRRGWTRSRRRFETTSSRSWKKSKKICRAAAALSCAARPKPCVPVISAWASV